MTDYPYEGTLVADAVTFQRAVQAAITVYDIDDTTNSTPLVLKDLSGLPLPNPLTSSADAFVQPFFAPTDGVKLVGGGLTVAAFSPKGIRDAAEASALAAQAAAGSAASAGAGAAAAASAALASAVADAEAAQAAAVAAAGLVGAPADSAVQTLINAGGSATRAALNATFATPASVASAIAALPAATSALPTGAPEVVDGKLFVTNSETAIRTQVTTTQTLTGTPSSLGNGVAATVDGVDVWVSPSGYMRPKATNFAKSSLWGSSSAANLGPELSAEMGGLGSDMHYASGAVGSFQMSHISAATGIRPMEVAAVTIPASGGVTIVPTNMPEANNTAVPVSWPGSFAGIAGTVTKPSGNATWTFTRTAAGSATAIPAGSKFIPSKPVDYQSGVTFLNLAKNTLTAPTTWGTYEECVRLTDLTYEYFSGAGRHVIMLGHYQTSPYPSGSAGFTAIAKYNAYVKARYGARYIDIQAYLSSAQVWTDTGLTPTQADLDAQAAQTLPPSLQLDASHLNGAGDTAVAKLIKARLQTLGWVIPAVNYAFTLTGVPTPSAQWNANSIPVATGADVTTWAPAAGGGALVSPNSAKAPSLEATGTEKYLRFAAADAELGWAGWSAFGTVTAIVRVSNFTAGSPIIDMGSINMQRSGSGNLAGYGGSFVTTPMSVDSWHVASFVIDGASSIIALNQTTNTGTIGAGVQSAFKIHKLDNGATMEIAAVLGWTEKLTAAQLQSVATQLKAARPALMP